MNDRQLEREFNSAINTFETMKSIIEDLESENKELKDRIGDLEDEKEELENKVYSLEEELSNCGG